MALPVTARASLQEGIEERTECADVPLDAECESDSVGIGAGWKPALAAVPLPHASVIDPPPICSCLSSPSLGASSRVGSGSGSGELTCAAPASKDPAGPDDGGGDDGGGDGHGDGGSGAGPLPVLPDAAPAALHQMLDTPGGARALAAAARSLLLNNPILQHPGAPCHALLTQLASLSAPAPHAPAHSASAIPTSGGLTEGNGGFRGPTQASYGAHRRNDGHYGMSPQLPSRSMPPPPPHLPRSMPPPMPRPPSHPGPGASSSAAGVSARDAWLGGAEPLRRDVSSEAVEVLSSNFFSCAGRVAASTSRGDAGGPRLPVCIDRSGEESAEDDTRDGF